MKKQKTIIVLLLLTFSVLAQIGLTQFIPFAYASGNYEDLTTYEEYDPNGEIEVTSPMANATAYDRNSDKRLLYDFGLDHFGSSWNISFMINMSRLEAGDADNRVWTTLVVVCQTNQSTSGDDEVSAVMQQNGANDDQFKIKLLQWDADVATTNLLGSYVYADDTAYYGVLGKDGDHIFISMYSDVLRTDLIQTVEDLNGVDDSYQYFDVLKTPALAVDPNDWFTGYIRDIQIGSSYFSQLVISDQGLGKEIAYNSNTSANHRLQVSIDSGMSPVHYTVWDNNTINPVFPIPSWWIYPNGTTYYQATIFTGDSQLAQDSIENFNTSMDASAPDTGFYIIDSKLLSEPYISQARIYYDTGRSQFVLISQHSQSGGYIDYPKVYLSTDGVNFTYQGEMFTAAEIPAGYSLSKTPVAVVLANGTRYLIMGLSRDSDSHQSSHLFRENTTTGWVEMEYLFVTAEDENAELQDNCRFATNLWYNSTDSKWYGYIGGGNGAGQWDFEYLASSSDLNFTGDLGAGDVYETADWQAGSWAEGNIYPISFLWKGGQGFGLVAGTGSGGSSDFDMDIAWATDPNSITSTTDFYSSNSASDAYGRTILDATSHFTEPSLIELPNGTIIAVTYNRETPTTDQEMYMFLFTGFWADELVTILPGSLPRAKYYTFPTKTEYNAMYDVEVRSWSNNVNVTISQMSGTAPTYSSFTISGTADDTIFMSIKDLTTDTVYLHVSEGDTSTYTITDSATGAIKTLTPGGTGNDFGFNFTITGAGAENVDPTVESFIISDLSDGDTLFKTLWYRPIMVVDDSDGLSDIGTAYFAFETDYGWHNVSYNYQTDVYAVETETGNIIIADGYTESSGTSLTIHFYLMLLDSMDVETLVDIYCRVTDVSSGDSGWSLEQSNYFNIEDYVADESPSGSGWNPSETPAEEPQEIWVDTDGDGIPNWDDDDIDGDQIPNEYDEDIDGDDLDNDVDPNPFIPEEIEKKPILFSFRTPSGAIINIINPMYYLKPYQEIIIPFLFLLLALLLYSIYRSRQKKSLDQRVSDKVTSLRGGMFK